jgi:hypothetical protein
MTILYALDAMDGLLDRTDPKATRWVETFDTWLVPVVNPDGVWTAMFIDHRHDGQGGRKNGRYFLTPCGEVFHPRRGVDLNRNYPFRWGTDGASADQIAWNYHGPAPGSEPETRAMMRLAAEQRFVAAITFHTWGSVVLSPYTIDDVDNPEPDVAWGVAHELASASPQRYRVLKNMYSVSGTDQDWMFHEFGTLAYIIEGSHHNPIVKTQRTASVSGMSAIWRRLYQRLIEGPAISGHTVDRDGQPIEADVRIENFTRNEGEHWTSRPRDGRFDRVLTDYGTFTVHASAPGYAPLSRHVVVSPEDPVPWQVLVLTPTKAAAH